MVSLVARVFLSSGISNGPKLAAMVFQVVSQGLQWYLWYIHLLGSVIVELQSASIWSVELMQ